MNSLSNLLHRTPWWTLILGGFAVIVGLAVFVTPFHLIDYRKEGATPEENKAIKREIDNTFAEGAIDLSRSAIIAMRRTTHDPKRREELDRALEELDRVREELRDAGEEARRAKREAVDTASEATREAITAIEDARRNAEQALKEAGIDNPKVTEALEQALKSAKEAEEEAKKALAKDDAERKRIVIGMGLGKDRPLLDIDVSKATPGEKRRVEIRTPGDAGKAPRGSITIDLDDRPKAPKAPPVPQAPVPPEAPAGFSKDFSKGFADGGNDAGPRAPPLPPELRAQIRENVNEDLKKIGVGAGLVLLFIPIFILTIVAKFFIDRSRAAQRLADLQRKEAEYQRMSRQVTEAKLQALQAQVEPHFLYNTLANVQALTEVDPAQANTMVGHLIQYLRSALPKMRESISTVGQELELVRAYLNILQMRMGKRLAFDISVPESLLATPFPPLMLPSLVENAIKHGLEPQREGGAVLITASAQDGRLRLVVSDTGRGFGETVGAGVGLANIRERLAGLYGDRAKLTLESNAPSGVIATIELPLDGLGTGAGGGAQAGGNAAGAFVTEAAAQKSRARKVLSAVGTVERTWRKSVSFAFVALVIVAAVVSGLGAFGVMTGILPVHIGSETLSGAPGALVGAAGIAIGFAALVLVLGVLAALVYGLGWLVLGLAIFIPLVVLIATLPATAPFILIGLFIWWLFRRKKRAPDAALAPVAPKVEPVMTAVVPEAAAPGKATPQTAPPGRDPPAG